MKRIKGNKENFAIESEITTAIPYLMGRLCLWIGGIQVGTFDDEVMLLTIKSSLMTFLKELEETENRKFIGMKKEELFAEIYGGKLDNGKYLLQLGESFDDFSMFAFKEKDSINFYWRLCEKPYFTYPNYSKDILHKKVKIAEIISTVQDKELWQP